MSASAVAEDSPLRVGAIIAEKYRLERELGRGGMGTVYEAVHVTIGKHVALKFLESQRDRDAQSRARFAREAQTASLVESPHIVHVFDSGCTSDGTPYMVLELLRGEDLRSRLKREGRLTIDQAVTTCEQILRALVRTHSAGIVHRDLKPENVYLCDHGDDSIFVKILDFGISKVTRSESTLDTLTHEGVVLGTAYYMSPEQARGETSVDGRSDLYAVGSIFFEMLSGRTPYVGNVYHAVLVDICTRDAADVRQLAPHVPEGLAQVIARALSRDREARYPSAQAMLESLSPFTHARLSSPAGITRVSTTRVSQPAPSSDTTRKAPSRLGKRLTWAFLFSIVASASLIIVIHRRFKADQAKERAMRESYSALRDRSTPLVSTPAPSAQLNSGATGAASTSIPQAPPANSGPSPVRHMGDSGGISRHASPRSSSGLADELRLKTEMP